MATFLWSHKNINWKLIAISRKLYFSFTVHHSKIAFATITHFRWLERCFIDYQGFLLKFSHSVILLWKKEFIHIQLKIYKYCWKNSETISKIHLIIRYLTVCFFFSFEFCRKMGYIHNNPECILKGYQVLYIKKKVCDFWFILFQTCFYNVLYIHKWIIFIYVEGCLSTNSVWPCEKVWMLSKYAKTQILVTE